jgi:hypothetical protein
MKVGYSAVLRASAYIGVDSAYQHSYTFKATSAIITANRIDKNSADIICNSAGSATVEISGEGFAGSSTYYNFKTTDVPVSCIPTVGSLLSVTTVPTPPPTPPNAPAVTLEVGQSTTLGVTVIAASSNTTASKASAFSAPTISFASDNTGVASVNSQGTITGGSVGTSTITVTATDGDASGSAQVKVQVDAATTPNVLVLPNPVNLALAGTQQLTLTSNGAAATTTGWFAVDQSVARVGVLTGLVTAAGAGSTIVTSGVTGASSGSGVAIVNVSGATQACATSGSYTFTNTVADDKYFSNSFVIGMPASLALAFTVSGTSVTVTGPAPFIGGTGTIDASCHVNVTATGTIKGVPNVAVLLTGTLPATGAAKFIYEVGTNGSMPRNRPVYYALVK